MSSSGQPLSGSSGGKLTAVNLPPQLPVYRYESAINFAIGVSYPTTFLKPGHSMPWIKSKASEGTDPSALPAVFNFDVFMFVKDTIVEI